MTMERDRPYVSHTLGEPSGQRRPEGREEVVAWFASRDAAEAAALALRRAGYRPTVARAEWEAVAPPLRAATLPVLLGAFGGMIAGALVAALWWGVTAFAGAGSPLALPITRALGAFMIYMLCILLGTWAGSRWRRGEELAATAEVLGDAVARYAVAAPAAGAEHERIRQVLEEYRGRDVEVRRAA